MCSWIKAHPQPLAGQRNLGHWGHQGPPHKNIPCLNLLWPQVDNKEMTFSFFFFFTVNCLKTKYICQTQLIYPTFSSTCHNNSYKIHQSLTSKSNIKSFRCVGKVQLAAWGFRIDQGYRSNCPAWRATLSLRSWWTGRPGRAGSYPTPQWGSEVNQKSGLMNYWLRK